MYREHQDYVVAWLARNAAGLPPEELVKLTDRLLHAIWQRSVVVLSEITLTAICERVLNNAQRQFPLLASATLNPDGIQLAPIAGNIVPLKANELKEAVQFLLVELLALLDRLTAEILTPALYAELSKVERAKVTERRGETENAPAGQRLPPPSGKRGQSE